MAHPASLSSDDLLAACDIQFTRRSGPGGQNRNKVETAVVLTHRPTGLMAQASEERTQADNRRAALKRLRLKLAVEHRQPPEPLRSDIWLARAAHGRLQVAAEHPDLPSLLAEALDVLSSCDFITSQAAESLQISPSQLVNLLRLHAPALALLNRQRMAAGKPPLR